MNLHLEANGKYGYGYQIRIDEQFILDNEPYNLYEAVHMAGEALERVNKMTGSSHELYDVLWLTQGGVEANARRDIASAKLALEFRNGIRKYVGLKDALHAEEGLAERQGVPGVEGYEVGASARLPRRQKRISRCRP